MCCHSITKITRNYITGAAMFVTVDCKGSNIASGTRKKKTLQAVPVLEGTLKIHGIIHKIAPVCLRSRKRHSFTVSSLNSIRDYFRLRKQHSVLFSLYFNSFRSFQPKPKRPTCHLLVLPQRGAASSTREKKMMLRYIGIV